MPKSVASNQGKLCSLVMGDLFVTSGAESILSMISVSGFRLSCSLRIVVIYLKQAKHKSNQFKIS